MLGCMADLGLTPCHHPTLSHREKGGHHNVWDERIEGCDKSEEGACPW